ncbi:hypothetical protein [Lunatibacter salilacus]|uniref:hypothetical protein n=1 Tax=Lunatibacter salilacus TaxID=2483804 RepID=UPI00131D7092|nr:hypothetical protein [Lunatibacter salilacus]
MTLKPFQYGHTDDRLTLAYWQNFGEKRFKEGDEVTFFEHRLLFRAVVSRAIFKTFGIYFI